jgi:hypothetical protein
MNLMQSTLILSATIAANTAFAEWTKVATSYQSTNYADLNSIQMVGEIASMDTLIDFKKAPFDGNNLPYLSLRMKGEYNCMTKEYRTVNLASYTGHMATGQQPYWSMEPTEWEAVLVKHTQEGLWKAACRKK